MVLSVPDSLADETPSTRLTYLILQAAESPLTRNEIAERAGLQPSTVGNNLQALRREIELRRRPCLRDKRANVYWLDDAGLVESLK